MAIPKSDDTTLWGWADISAALGGVNQQTAKNYARRGMCRSRRSDVLNVWLDYRGPFITRADLSAWRKRNPAEVASERGAGIVYAFLDLDGDVRYVGQTRQGLAERVSQHLDSCESPAAPFSWWLAWFVSVNNRLPRVIVLERADANLDAREQHWIRRYAATAYNSMHMPKAAA